MKFGSLTLAGGDRDDKIPACVESAWACGVDVIVLIDTGPSAKKAIAKVLQMSMARFGNAFMDHLQIVKFPGEYRFCSEGRNFCFEVAASLGLDFMLMLDTDMRLDPRGNDIRGFLEATTDDVVCISTAYELLAKPMFWRVPVKGRCYDDPHEHFEPLRHPLTTIEGPICWEAERTKAEWQAWAQAVLDGLQPHLQANPRDARRLWYAADALEKLDRFLEAIVIYEEAAEHEIRRDLKARCWFAVARCRFMLGGFEACTVAALIGKDLMPDAPEFWCFAGASEQRQGNNAMAIWFAEQAIEVAEGQRARDSWTYMQAWYEWPYDVLRHAYNACGRFEEGSRAMFLHDERQADRLEETSVPWAH